MLGPVGGLGGAQGIGEVAGAVAQQQLGQAAVVEAGAGGGQLLRAELEQRLQPAPVGVADEAAIQVFVHVGRGLARRAGVDLRPQRAQVGQRAQPLGVARGLRHVDAPALGQFRPQGLEVGDDDGGLVQVHALDGQARHAFGQIGRGGEQALAHLPGLQVGQLGRVGRQVPGQQLVLVGGVHGQRPHQRDAAARGAEHAAHVQERPRVLQRGGQAQLLRHALLFPQLEAEVEQARLPVAQQAGQGDGGAHVGQGVVRAVVQQAVGGAELFQPEAGQAVVALRPCDALGPQRVGGAHDVEQVPAAAAVLPLARVGIAQVAPEHEARDLVVEADRVVAHAHGAGLGQQRLHAGGEGVLGQAALGAQLRRDAGDEAGLGLGQRVGGGLTVEHLRRADLVQRGVGADGRELRRPVAPRVDAEGFVVVPEEGMRGVGHAGGYCRGWVGLPAHRPGCHAVRPLEILCKSGLQPLSGLRWQLSSK